MTTVGELVTERGPSAPVRDADPEHPTPSRWAGWTGSLTMAGAWVIANVVWFQANRGAHLFDHEEVGYVRGVAHFGRLRQPASMWDDLHNGYTGPMQALLGAPSQWLFGASEATVFWENIALTAASVLLAYWMVRRLADGVAGLAAAALVLATPGMLENARGALTMVPATTFAVLALAALVVGGGLARLRWSFVFGAALGAMSLSRTMSIAFVPGLAVPAVVWSMTNRVPRAVVIRNGAIAGVTAVAVSIWWWAISYPQVFDYLKVGAANVETSGPAGIFVSRISELILYLSPVTILIAGVGYLVVRAGQDRRTRSAESSAARSDHADVIDLVAIEADASAASVPSASSARAVDGSMTTTVAPVTDRAPARSRWIEAVGTATAPCGVDAALPLWPIWAAVGTNVVVSLASNTVGWLMLPVAPWLIVAAVAGAWRRLDARAWRSWAVAVVGATVVAALVMSVVWVVPGNRFTWCWERIQHTSACPITSNDLAEPWRPDLDTIADDTFDLQQHPAHRGAAGLRSRWRRGDHLVSSVEHPDVGRAAPPVDLRRLPLLRPRPVEGGPARRAAGGPPTSSIISPDVGAGGAHHGHVRPRRAGRRAASARASPTAVR